MKLENQVCSLESAKRLRELGVKQESLFYWIHTVRGPEIFNHNIIENGEVCGVSAYTVAELGEMLPKKIISQDIRTPLTKEATYYLDCSFTSHSFKVHYVLGNGPGEINYEEANTEAEARSKMLIYLIENGIVKVNHAN